jgi:Mg/Co/Ni transporter MgtE
MVSTAQASKILFENDPDKRAEMIEKLSEEAAKHLLKMAIKYMCGEAEY